MARYKNLDRSQGLFVTVNLEEQLLPNTFECTLDYIVDRLDLSSFDAAFHNDQTGAPAYPPAVMLKISFSCYSKGIVSSRRIEQACTTNSVVKALARDAEPDHDTIAHCISSQAEADLFSPVLFKCHGLGLVGGDVFAVDGCKLPSNAAKERSGTLEELEQKRKDAETLMERIVRQHVGLDREGREGSGLNGTAASYVFDREYQERQLERLEKKLTAPDHVLETAEPRRGRSGDEVKSKVTDHERALLKSSHGYIQGYNGIGIADSKSQVRVAAEAF